MKPGRSAPFGVASALFGWISALPEPVAEKGRARWRIWLFLSCLALLGIDTVIASTIYAGGQSYSQQQVANMFANSSNPYLAANASTFAAMSHNVEDPNGNTGTYNGSCCTGLMQLNNGNLATFCNCTKQEFAAMSGQQQIDVYTKYFNSVQNDSSIKQLEQMQANGQSLGGQPVDGSMIAACAQLGTGNCRKAIANGCRSAAAADGGDGSVSICTMAAKANGGKVVQPDGQPVTAGTDSPAASTGGSVPATAPAPSNSTITTGDLSQSQSIQYTSQTFTPEDPGASGSLMKIGDPTFCWICDGAIYSLGVVEALDDQGSATILALVWPLFVVLASIAAMMAIGTAVLAGRNPWPVALNRFGKMALVFSLMYGGSFQAFGTDGSSAVRDPSSGGIDFSYALPVASADGSYAPKTFTASSSSGSLMFDYIVSPPIQLGATIGTDLIATASTAFGMQLPSGNCQHDDQSSAGVVKLSAAGTALVTFACQVHVAASTAIQVGGILVTHPHTDQSKVEIGAGFVLFFVGALVMFMAGMALVNFGFALIEAILKIGIVCAFLPIYLFSWLFDATRGMVKVVFDAAVFSFFYLVFSGLGAAVMVFVFMKAFAFGLGNQSQSLDIVSAVSAFDQIAAQQGLTTAQGFSQLILFATFTSAGALLSSRILGGAHDLALEISEFSLGERGELSRVGQKVVNRAVGVASVGAGVAGTLAGRAIGRGAGRLGGRASALRGAFKGPAKGVRTRLAGARPPISR